MAAYVASCTSVFFGLLSAERATGPGFEITWTYVGSGCCRQLKQGSSEKQEKEFYTAWEFFFFVALISKQ